VPTGHPHHPPHRGHGWFWNLLIHLFHWFRRFHLFG
jgi:hypothetical protein